MRPLSTLFPAALTVLLTASCDSGFARCDLDNDARFSRFTAEIREALEAVDNPPSLGSLQSVAGDVSTGSVGFPRCGTESHPPWACTIDAAAVSDGHRPSLVIAVRSGDPDCSSRTVVSLEFLPDQQWWRARIRGFASDDAFRSWWRHREAEEP